MNEIKKYNIVECVIKADLFEIPYKLELIRDILDVDSLVVPEQKRKDEKFAAIGEQTAQIVHDIKNPLSVIMAALDNINMTKDNPKILEKSLAVSFRAVDRIKNRLDTMMDVLKSSKLNIEPVSIKGVVDTIILELDILGEIKIHLPKNDIIIQADVARIETLFSNLITNAIQAMENKGTLTIRISEKTKNVVQIDVENDGPSILEENFEKIFEPLFTTKPTGFGLGLASCKKIVEEHYGTISVKNNPTTFTIIVPRGTQT